MQIPRQETITLAVPPRIRQQLVGAGFRTIGDLQDVGPVDLAKECGLSLEEAYEVLQSITSSFLTGWQLSGAKSAVELHQVQKQSRKIITFCNELDKVLGGGVWTGQVTEFCGVPGVGKTQIGMQLAVDVQIPCVFHGCEGTTVYIDTEGSFMVERLHDIATAAVKHIQSIAEKSGKQAHLEAAQKFTVDSVLSNIHYFRIYDYVEQLALLNMLEPFLDQHPQVKAIVVDSITFHFRQDFKDMAHRTRVLTQMAQDLMKIAERRQLAVIFMNQVTTRVNDDQTSKLIPALGESWGHAASTRVILYWQNNERYAYIYKSPCMPPATASFLVTAGGIRGNRAERKNL